MPKGGCVGSGPTVPAALAKTALNMLTRRRFKGLTGLDFLYLLAGSPTDAWGDVYLQKTLPGGMPLAGAPLQAGFASPAGSTVPDHDEILPSLRIATTEHRPARGLYRWPTAWLGSWTGAHGGHAHLNALSRTTVGQYGIAGFAMSIVSGTWHRDDGIELPLYGFGELFAAGRVLRRLAGVDSASPSSQAR